MTTFFKIKQLKIKSRAVVARFPDWTCSNKIFEYEYDQLMACGLNKQLNVTLLSFKKCRRQN